ncbi:MAG TPA: LCP family protein [Anaerolineales bacterium]|nr:LCP family protein [Anaerolineales bacterium]
MSDLMLENTRPSRRLDRFQAMRAAPAPKRRTRRLWIWILPALFIIYLLAPLRTNILLLGTDDLPERGAVGRTDTIILATIVPTRPYIGLLSIPRDLWVNIPDVGEQRINTAYFFAEANESGSGPRAAMQTIHQNFGIPVRYYGVVHMFGLVSAVDALGGVDIHLDSAMGSWQAGDHHLNGSQALDFVRDRSSSDDFSRMRRTQVLILSLAGRALQPANWTRLPNFVDAVVQAVDTNIPIWQLPRLAFAVLRVPLFGIDSQVISREMTTPFQTSGGAQVLAPNWDAIRPVLQTMFGG